MVTNCRNLATLPMAGNISQESDETSRKMKLSESNKPPVLTFCISRIVRAGHLRSVSHISSPIISLWGFPDLLILQDKLYNPNSDTSHIVVTHYCHVSTLFLHFLLHYEYCCPKFYIIAVYSENYIVGRYIHTSLKKSKLIHTGIAS